MASAWGRPTKLDPRDWEPIDNPAVGVVADLESQGIDLTGLRILRVVCRHNRHLAEVLRYDRRLILRYGLVESHAIVPMTEQERIAAARLLERYGVTVRERTVRQSGNETHTAYLDAMGGAGIKAANHCCIESIPFTWIHEALRDGRKRKMFASSEPPARLYSRLDFG